MRLDTRVRQVIDYWLITSSFPVHRFTGVFVGIVTLSFIIIIILVTIVGWLELHLVSEICSFVFVFTLLLRVLSDRHESKSSYDKTIHWHLKCCWMDSFNIE
jgi:purine-cytosine permease-like protein